MPLQRDSSLVMVVLVWHGQWSLPPQLTINVCLRISLFFVSLFPYFYPLSSLTLGDVLCVSISDLGRGSGSTKGWFPCFWFVCEFSFINFLPFSYRVLFHYISKLVVLLLLLVISLRVIKSTEGIFPFDGPSPFAEYGCCFPKAG